MSMLLTSRTLKIDRNKWDDENDVIISRFETGIGDKLLTVNIFVTLRYCQ